MPLRDTQASFGAGEVTPALWGRTDLQKYKTALRTARNGNILPQGGFRNRPGTKYIASAGDSTKAIRLIPFIASATASYIIELGDYYARFYTAGAQVAASGVSAWITSTPYVVGNFVTNSGTTYYCIVAHTSGVFATDLAAGKWIAQTAYQIVTPWAAADIFKLRFAQSADVMYFAHPSYAPRQLTFTSSASWAIALYPYINGPFMVQNTDTTSTITASALSGSVTLTASKSIFAATQVGGLFELITTVIGQTISPALTTNAKNWCPTGSTWQAVISGSWTGTILVQKSTDQVTWTTIQTVVANGTYSGSTSFTVGYIRAIMKTTIVSFSGSATVQLNGVGSSSGANNLSAASVATTPIAAAGDTVRINISGTWVGTVKNQYSIDGGVTWTTLGTAYTGNQVNTTDATGIANCIVRALFTAYTSGTAVVTCDGQAGAAPTNTFTISTASVSAAIMCGSTYTVVTSGAWTGKLRFEISTDAGTNWALVQVLQSDGTQNYNVSGSTGVGQCLLRVSTDITTAAFSGTATVDLTSNSFDWKGVVLLTVFSSATSVTGTVQNLSNTDSTGLADTSSTWQWSEGSWSTYRGFPGCVTFYQDRAAWASTVGEPNTVWHSKTASYADFGVSSPLVDDDGFNVVLASRQLNAISSLVPMSQAMICLTGDTDFGLSPGSTGIYSATSVQQTPMDHRGSYNIDPVIVGNEVILIQQMGTVVRNLIFQLAVNGFMGDNLSVASQHLFTGYTIAQMAYQQEPDSIIWLVRSDGQLLSCTYDRAQEMNAWTHHDTQDGLYESVACIPNTTLGINEVWFVVKRGSTRFIEALKPRDQGTAPEDQWFVDSGVLYDSTPLTVITGLSHLNGKTVAVLADGNVVANGINDDVPVVVSGGQITLAVAASVVLVGIPIVWDVALLDIEAPNPKGTMQGQRVKQPRANIRVWNSRGGYISTTDPESSTGLTDTSGGEFDAIADIMQRDPDTDLDTPMPLVTGIADVALPSGYQYGSHICLRGIDPLPFTLLDVISDVVPGGN